MSRQSPQLQRALRLCRRFRQSRDLAGVLAGALSRWSGARARWTQAEDAGSGAATLYVEICGRVSRVLIEPLDYTDPILTGIAWQPIPSCAPELRARNAVLQGGPGENSAEAQDGTTEVP